jgi:hypothetical protein
MRWSEIQFAGMLAMVLLAVGCVSQKPTPLPAPAMVVTQSQFVGDAVSGPQRGTVIADAKKGAIVAHVLLYAATEIATDKLDPLGTGARLVLAKRDGQRMIATGEVTSIARWARSPLAQTFAAQLDVLPPKQVVKWRDQRFLLPAGITASLDALDETTHRQLRLDVSNVTKALPIESEISLSTENEQAVLRPIAVGDGSTVAIAIPFEPTGSTTKIIAAIVQFEAPPQKDDAFAAMLDQCKQAVQHESEQVEQRLADRLNNPAAKTWPAFEAAREAAKDPKTRRAAMVYLSAQAGATFSRDIYLIADDALLARLLDDVALRVAAASNDDRSTAALAWLLDLSTFQTLAKLASENQLSPQLQPVLTDFAGEAGRHPASLDEINRKLATRAELDSRLIAENTIYLDDSSPAARVRAFDWLKSHGKAPASFDPLGSPRQRRDALQASR